MAWPHSRYPDKWSMGRSKLVPFIHGEEPEVRHQRRLETNFRGWHQMQQWCQRHGVEFDMLENGRHWTFVKGDLYADWWPREAKFVANGAWRQSVHVHDYEQCIARLRVVLEPHRSLRPAVS
jgi:hypothetical protein